MTVDEFEDALGKQFEGIELGLDKAIPTIKDTESSITQIVLQQKLIFLIRLIRKIG